MKKTNKKKKHFQTVKMELWKANRTGFSVLSKSKLLKAIADIVKDEDWFLSTLVQLLPLLGYEGGVFKV